MGKVSLTGTLYPAATLSSERISGSRSSSLGAHKNLKDYRIRLSSFENEPLRKFRLREVQSSLKMSQFDNSPWPVQDVSCSLPCLSLSCLLLVGNFADASPRFLDRLYGYCWLGHDSCIFGVVSMACGLHVLSGQGISESRALVGQSISSRCRHCFYSPEVCSSSNRCQPESQR